MIVTTIDKTPRCDGACEAHTGALRMVFVQGWGKFLYCDAAVKEDERRGLVVSDFVEDDAHHRASGLRGITLELNDERSKYGRTTC